MTQETQKFLDVSIDQNDGPAIIRIQLCCRLRSFIIIIWVAIALMLARSSMIDAVFSWISDWLIYGSW